MRSGARAPCSPYCTGVLHYMGRSGEAVAVLRRAESLDPNSIMVRNNLTLALYRNRQYDAAIEQARRTPDLDPKYSSSQIGLGLSYLGKGDTEAAIQTGREAGNLASLQEDAEGLTYVGYALGRAGQRKEALEIMAQVQKMARKQFVSAVGLARLHIGVGQQNRFWRRRITAGSHNCGKYRAIRCSIRCGPIRDMLRCCVRLTGNRRPTCRDYDKS